MENFFRPMGVALRAWRVGIETLFPRFCLRCEAEGVAWCQPCDEAYVLRAAPMACPFCGREGSDRTCEECQPHVFLDGLSALTFYADRHVRGALTTWKYYGDDAYGGAALRWVRRGATRLTIPDFPFFVTHVPLHASRKRERGFDQAEKIAQTIAAEFGLEHVSLLRRTTSTSPQAARDHSARHLGELDGVFRAFPPVPDHVILCDDVFTSGVTMDAAAKALKEAGAKVVWGAVVARGKAA